MLYPELNDLIAFKNRKSEPALPSYRTGTSIVQGDHHSPFRGQGLEFDAVREYVPGDDIRNIDWRVTARTGSPHLKLFKQERERHVLLCIDMNSTMRFGTRNTFKSVQAARVAAILGWRGLAHHDRISGCLFGDVPNGMQYFAPKRTPKSFCTLLKRLTEPFAEQHSILFSDILTQINQAAQTGSLIYIISDFMNIQQNFQNQAGLRQLIKRCDVVFISINDPADKSIFPIGTIAFCASKQEKFYVNTASDNGREAYEAQWRSNRQHLYEAAAKLKIPLIELSTESDLYRDLSFQLKKITKRKKR